MRTERRSSRSPIAIDRHFLEKLSSLIADFDEAVAGIIAEQFDVSKGELKELAENLPPEFDRDGSYDIDDYYEKRSIVSRYRTALEKEITLVYEGGVTIELDSIEGIEPTLKLEVGKTTKLDVRMGSHRVLRFSLQIESRMSSNSEFAVQGRNPHVSHLAKLAGELIDSSKPDNAFLHLEAAAVTCRIVVLVSLSMATILLLRRATFVPAEIDALLLGVSLIIWVIISGIPSRLWAKLFPSVQFEFGRQHTEIESKRGLYFWIGGSIIFPIAVALAL